MISEQIKAKGVVTLLLCDAQGNVKQTETPNLVVNTGLALIASRLIGTSSATISHIGIGTSTTAAAAAQTDLITPIVRVAITGGTGTLVTTNVSNDSVQYVATFNAGVGTGAITEVGLFNAASAGTMLARTTFAVINKGASDVLTVTWKIVVA